MKEASLTWTSSCLPQVWEAKNIDGKKNFRVLKSYCYMCELKTKWKYKAMKRQLDQRNIYANFFFLYVQEGFAFIISNVKRISWFILIIFYEPKAWSCIQWASVAKIIFENNFFCHSWSQTVMWRYPQSLTHCESYTMSGKRKWKRKTHLTQYFHSQLTYLICCSFSGKRVQNTTPLRGSIARFRGTPITGSLTWIIASSANWSPTKNG